MENKTFYKKKSLLKFYKLALNKPITIDKILYYTIWDFFIKNLFLTHINLL